MLTRMKVILRGIAAMVIGYAVIVVITSIGFEYVGQRLYGAQPATLIKGALVAVVAGLAGGLAAGFIGAKRGLVNAAPVLIFLAIDTTYVLFFFQPRRAPLWFDLMGSLTLMACALIGGRLRDYFAARYTISPPTTV